MNLQQDLTKTTYSIVGKEITMYSDPEVWSPYSAKEMLEFLTEYGYLEEIEHLKVLDIGTGSGIIGIMCGLLGAKDISVSDYSLPAVQLALQNASLNQLKIKGIQSNCFENLTYQTFDFIISNPPVQPWLFTDLEHPEKRVSSAAWNEAGADGRLVLDALIKEGKNHLTHKGKIITSCSTRHGHNQTLTLLNNYWKNHWHQIYASEQMIDTTYHAPYLPTWWHLQALDLDLRVYQKDAKGRKLAIQKNEDGTTFILTTIILQDDMPTNVKLFSTNKGWEVLDKNNRILAYLDENDNRIPIQPIDNQWYYQYILIEMEKA